MTNSEQVAKKLREAGERLDKEAPRDILAAAICVLHEFLDATDIRENNSYSAVFSSLADLIDPTCEYLPVTCAVWFDDNDEEHVDKHLEAFENAGTAFCSCCGYIVMTGEEGWFDYERKEHGNLLIPNFNYCPSCGARVVQDDL